MRPFTHQTTFEKKPISVVIPTYNGLKILQENLPSVLNSLRTGDELLIVDDASDDQTSAWLTDEFALETELTVNDQLGEFSLLTGQWRVEAVAASNRSPDISDNSTVKVDAVTGQILQTEKKSGLVDQETASAKSKEKDQSSLLSTKQGQMKLVINQENLRFAASCNRAVAQSRDQLILLLNNDVKPEPDLVAHLIPHFSDSKLFAVGCLETEPGNEEVSGKNKIWFEKGLFHHSKADDFTAGQTAWVSGGSGMFAKDKWQQLGGFDLRFSPAYWEDIDLSFRARRHQWRVWFEPEARVEHDHETTNKSALGLLQMREVSWRNADKFTLKNANIWQKIMFFLWRPYWWWQRYQARKKQLSEFADS